MAFSKAMLSIKVTLASMGFAAIFAAIGWVTSKFYNAYNESKRIKGLFDDYSKRMNNISASNTEIVKVKALLSEYNKANSSLSRKNRY